jgi:cytoskeletal protein CcmA (bactofilin family)
MFRKVLSLFVLVSLLALTFAAPAHAFDGREGDRVVIAAGEVIEDDLYVGAQSFTLDGTVKGDLIVGAQTVVINGTVEGDLIVGAQAIQINGTVTDDARVFGQAAQLGAQAVIGDDLIFGGASLELLEGSHVSGDLVMGAGQALLAGKVDGNLLAGVAGLELRGAFGGNVYAYVDQTEESVGSPSPSSFMTYGQPLPFSMPSVSMGLTVADGATIAGDLEYSSTYELSFPGGAVGGNVTRVEPVSSSSGVQVDISDTPAQKTGSWAFDLLRSIVTLGLFGLLMVWLAPKFSKSATEKLQSNPLPTLGWGVVTYAGFFFALLAIIVVMVLGGTIFGLLTLGGVTGTIIWVGLLALFGLTVLFVLAVLFVSKILVGTALGKWIFGLINPSLAEHKVWPMLVGVTTLALVIGLFNIPLLSLGFFGWVINFLVVLFGLGALWLWGRERFSKHPAEITQ